MMRKTLTATAVAVLAAGSAQAGTGAFTNGGFEDGTLNGWTVDGGTIQANSNYSCSAGSTCNSSVLMTAANFTGSATTTSTADFTATHNKALAAVTVTNVGTDAITGGALSTVRYGAHAVRVNDPINNYSVSLIQQKVTAYAASSINFSWAAVLQASHGPTDSDEFKIQLKDETSGTIVYSVAYNSTVSGGLFTSLSNGWKYSQWQDQAISVTAGHDFTLTLLANDCPYGGHSGYVYLDGFGSVAGGGGDGTTPEPTSLALVGLALCGAAGARRVRKARKA